MSIQINPAALDRLFNAQPANQGAPQSTTPGADFCVTMSVFRCWMEMEFDYCAHEAFDFDEYWDKILEMPLKLSSVKARMLLPSVVAEGGDVWNRLQKKLEASKGAPHEQQLLEILAWLLRYPEVPAPDPAFIESIAAIHNRFQVHLPDDAHWKNLDISDPDDAITQIAASSLLLKNRQLEFIWDKLMQGSIDLVKGQIIFACILFYPPRFWTNRLAEITHLSFGFLPAGEVKKQLTLLSNAYQSTMIKSGIFKEMFKGMFEVMRQREDVLLLKGIFNLVWARREDLSSDQLNTLTCHIETPLEWQEIALHINRNYQLFMNNQKEYGLVIARALFKESAAVHLSETVLKDFMGDGYDLPTLSEEKKLEFINCLSRLVDNLINALKDPERKAQTHLLRYLSLTFLWLERWPRVFVEQNQELVTELFLRTSFLLVQLNRDDEQQRRISDAFTRRAKRLLNANQHREFLGNSFSLSNNFIGEAYYGSPAIYTAMKHEYTTNGKRWFDANLKRFETIMEDAVILEKASWNTFQILFRLYIEYFPKKEGWMAKAISCKVRREPNDSDPQFPDFLRSATFSIDRLKQTTKPGTALLALLRKAVEQANDLPENTPQKAFDWANAILKEVHPDDQYWIEVQTLFKSMVQKIPKKPGSKGPQFEIVWGKFEKKIGEANSPDQILKSMIDQKRAEVHAQTTQQLWLVHSLYQNRYEGILDDESRERIQEQLNKLPAAGAALKYSLEEELLKLYQIRKASELKLKLDAVSEKTVQMASEKSKEVKREVKAIGNAVLERIRLEKERKAILEQPLPVSELNRFAPIMERQANREKEWLMSRAKAINEADEVHDVDQKFTALWKESAHHFAVQMQEAVLAQLPLRETKKARIIKQQQEEIEQLKALLKAKEAEVEHLQKQPALNPVAMPQERVTVEWKKPRDALVEQLKNAQALARVAEKALPMIQQEGDILRSVKKIKKFLALFGIKQVRQSGTSHKVFNEARPISNHAKESKAQAKPEEIRAALEDALAFCQALSGDDVVNQLTR